MKIYLLKDLKSKGKAGDIIECNDGYARNFVIKNGYGKVADAGVISHVRAQAESNAFHKAEDITEIKKTIEKLKDVHIELSAKVGAGGKMFGGITGTEISAELDKLGFNIEKKNLVFDQIKSVGSYKIKVKFNYAMSGEFVLIVRGE